MRLSADSHNASGCHFPAFSPHPIADILDLLILDALDVLPHLHYCQWLAQSTVAIMAIG